MAERSGSYRLVVRPFLENAAPGRYRVRVDGPRAPRPADRARIAGHAGDARGRRRVPEGHGGARSPTWRGPSRSGRAWASGAARPRPVPDGGDLAGLGRTAEAAERFHRPSPSGRSSACPSGAPGPCSRAARATGPAPGEEGSEHWRRRWARRRARSTLLELRPSRPSAASTTGSRGPRPAYLERALRLARESGRPDMEMRCLLPARATPTTTSPRSRRRCASMSRPCSSPASCRRPGRGQRPQQHRAPLRLAGRPGEADQHLEQALEISRTGKATLPGAALNNLALAYEKLDPPTGPRASTRGPWRSAGGPATGRSRPRPRQPGPPGPRARGAPPARWSAAAAPSSLAAGDPGVESHVRSSWEGPSPARRPGGLPARAAGGPRPEPRAPGPRRASPR